MRAGMSASITHIHVQSRQEFLLPLQHARVALLGNKFYFFFFFFFLANVFLHLKKSSTLHILKIVIFDSKEYSLFHPKLSLFHFFFLEYFTIGGYSIPVKPASFKSPYLQESITRSGHIKICIINY